MGPLKSQRYLELHPFSFQLPNELFKWSFLYVLFKACLLIYSVFTLVSLLQKNA